VLSAVQEETRRLPVIWDRRAVAMYGIACHVAAWMVFLCAAALAASPEGSESPTEAVRGTVDQVISILEDPALKDPSKLMPRRRMLEEVIATRFDYAEMSKRALAAYWVPLTAAERTEFVEVFKDFLSDRYTEKIEGYSGQQVVYLSERIEGSYAEVRTELRSEKTTIPLDYRLILNEGRWHAYDLIADGVSLVKNYRSQFQKVIRESSYQELVKKLRERTLVEETKNKP
jgi:phospholipid transport system substrate-binding protein